MSSPHLISQPHNPVSYRLYHIGGEAGAGLGDFCTTRKSWLPGAGQGASETKLFLQVFKFFYLLTHPGSPLSSAMTSSGAVQAMFVFSFPWYDTVSYLSLVGTQRAACCSSSAMVIQTDDSCSCLCPGKRACPAANRNGRPKLNLSFITTFNPIYTWT